MRGDINFKIVKGYDIIKYFDEKNYSYNAVLGTRLGDSCMRYSFCKDYIEFYAINEDNVSLLILMENDKIKGSMYWYGYNIDVIRFSNSVATCSINSS